MENSNSASHDAELLRCATDFIYFCETYVNIHHPKRGLVPFKLHDYQKRYVKHLEDHRFVIGRKFRQGGFSTTNMAWLAWRLLFKFDEDNMVLCKSDREAVECSRIVRLILNALPEWLSPEYGKLNDHTVENKQTNSKILFSAPEARCGRQLNYLFIEEAAFIPEMECHWKAMFPTICTGGRCVVTSTVNGLGNWFHEIYTAAKDGTNDFKVFECEYYEHPDYNNPEWVEMMKKNLGMRGWHQEVLGDFLGSEPDQEYVDDLRKRAKECERLADEAALRIDILEKGEKVLEEDNKPIEEKPPTVAESHAKWFAEQKEKQKDDFCMVSSPQEEKRKLWEFKQRAVKNGVPVKGNRLGEGITDNNEPPRLVGDLDHSFKNTNFMERPITQLNFDNVARPQNFRSYHWSDDAEEFAEWHIFANNDDSLSKCIEVKRQNVRDLEARVEKDFCGMGDDMLLLAGVITEQEKRANEDAKEWDDLGRGQVAQEILAKVLKLEKFPESLQISFSNKKLCVNGVPTNMLEFDLCCLYSGLSAFTTHEKAVDKIAKLICKRMVPLFGERKEK